MCLYKLHAANFTLMSGLWAESGPFWTFLQSKRGRRLYVSCGSKHTCMWSVNRPCHAGVYSDRSADWLTCGTFTPGPVGNQSTKWASDNPDPDWLGFR
ncbi:hypothetical protein SKAU_G00422030 [Synaphobranchus kaupii]|uniref:Uncharacterized protein n=1 Tax=Synaphobranchus kaupii TaxID=118154 RepID=A0A9Q1E6X8_SYNKA|nr:hypothetical protein SKAU_G00422030 [Synaphobranchus kaupii]